MLEFANGPGRGRSWAAVCCCGLVRQKGRRVLVIAPQLPEQLGKLGHANMMRNALSGRDGPEEMPIFR